MTELPIFRSHYSIGKSILTLDDPAEDKDNRADSVFRVAQNLELNTVFIADENPSGFINAIKNSRLAKLKVRLGIKMVLCENKLETRDGNVDEHKVIIWSKNDEGYHNLYRLYSDAAVNTVASYPRLDYSTLKRNWSSKDNCITIPFYSSFIHKNCMYGGLCMPDLDFAQPRMQIEENSLPFNFLLREAVQKWSNAKGWPIINTKSVYYAKKSDFDAYMAMRCMNQGTTMMQPELPHFSSDEFCAEAIQ